MFRRIAPANDLLGDKAAPVKRRIPLAIQNMLVFPTSAESIELAAKLKAIRRYGYGRFEINKPDDPEEPEPEMVVAKRR